MMALPMDKICPRKNYRKGAIVLWIIPEWAVV